ncbi:hypothetical protein [Thauera sp.]|uniref:hypothetical protein n=1 Tax=Thauera sp. TaxID=1905334 RepID=UPI0026354A95|nr:hypothetical protein [Thauera sp.]
MTQNLLITGAGVDCTQGIGFPMAATLLPEIAAYIEGEGKSVDQTLRSLLPNLRFTFSSMIARAVDAISTRGAEAQRAMVQRVQHAIDELPPERDDIRKHGELIVRLFNKLAVIAKEGELDDETRQLIREVFPKDADELMDSDSILDIHKLSLSDTFKAVLKRTLKLGLKADRHEVAEALGADMLNIEVLLVEKFLGFYNESLPDIKNYLYISWVLWAYLVEKQKTIIAAFPDGELPFYGKLPSDCHAITLNYTSFLERQLGRERVIYFHGGLAEYVSMATRELIAIDEDMAALDPTEFLKGQTENIHFGDDASSHRHVIPALVPPLRLKPILSHRYIEAWHQASEWVRNAKHIVVIGYSFNGADEHFNDILRQQLHGKAVTIVGPGVHDDSFLKRMEKVFHVPRANWVSTKVQNLPAKRANRFQLVKAYADQVDVGELFA